MAHTLPELPYAKNALAPHISEETFEYHYGKHHQAYVNNLNGLLEGTGLENLTLEQLLAAQDKWPSDKKAGIFHDETKMHVLDHKGKYFTVRGPLNVARPPQGHPIVVQAGASEQGRELAAATGIDSSNIRSYESGRAMPKSVPDNVARLPERPLRPGVPSRTVMPKVKRASGAANEVDDEWEEF